MQISSFESSSEPTIAFWWIVERIGDADTPRKKVRDMLARYIKMYSDSLHAARAKAYLAIVDRTLGEKRPPDDKKIERLIFDLRDLNLRHGAFRFRGANANRDAAQQLYDIGYDVLPSLIDHADDDTLTRCVDYGRPFAFSHRVLTVGDCCRQIIVSILPSGRQFDFSGNPELAKQSMKNHYRHLVAQKVAEQSIEP